MAFEKYIKTTNKQLSYPAITITQKGMFNINEKCLEVLKGAKYLELFYDKENEKIGILPHKEETDNSYKLNNNPKRARYKTFSGRTFLNHFNIHFVDKVIIPVGVDKKTGMLELNLEDAIEKPSIQISVDKRPKVKSKSNISSDLEV